MKTTKETDIMPATPATLTKPPENNSTDHKGHASTITFKWRRGPWNPSDRGAYWETEAPWSPKLAVLTQLPNSVWELVTMRFTVLKEFPAPADYPEARQWAEEFMTQRADRT